MPDTIEASTGQGNGVWGDLFSGLGQAAEIGGDLYNTVTGRGAPALTTATQSTPSTGPTLPPSTASRLSSYLPWIITAGGVIILVLLFVRRR